MPTRSFSVRNVREHTCPVCRATYEKRNSLNRHIKAKHVPKLKCFFCDKTFPADRNNRRSLHMLKSHRYPVPETFLSGPLNSCLDFNLRDSSINVVSNSDYVVPAPAQVSAPTDLAALFPVEEPDFSGIPSVHLPSSTTPSRCSTPLMDEQQAPGPQTTDSEVGNVLPPSPLEATAVQPPTVASTPEGRPTLSLFSDADVGIRLPPVLLEEFAMTPAPANSSETGSDPP